MMPALPFTNATSASSTFLWTPTTQQSGPNNVSSTATAGGLQVTLSTAILVTAAATDGINPTNFASVTNRSLSGIAYLSTSVLSLTQPGRDFTVKSESWKSGFGNRFQTTSSALKSGSCHGGIFENSPTLQRWVDARNVASPEGTAEGAYGFSRPSG